MNFKKNWKRFCDLSSAREGFTLVELIVVIAILAILAGVAVPAYSGYVKKANMQADMTLASEVAHALTLYYYAHPEEVTSGYVVLTTTGASGDGVVGDAAMAAVFGENWAETAVLKYDGWDDNGMMDLVGDYTDDELALIANSSFLTHSNAEGLMGAVTGLTGLVGDVIREKSADPAKARSNLEKIFGADSEILDKLDELDEDGLQGEDYPTAISNLLVNYMANTIETEPYLQSMINMYATAFAYAEQTGDTAALDKMNETLAGITMDELSYEGEDALDQGMFKMLEGMQVETAEGEVPLTEYAGFLDYVNETGEDQMLTDIDALSTMMGAVKQISDSFLDVESVTNPELFASGEVADQVSNYLNAVKVMNASGGTLSKIEPGTIVVYIDSTGKVQPVPTNVFQGN